MHKKNTMRVVNTDNEGFYKKINKYRIYIIKKIYIYIFIYFLIVELRD